jgi:microcin C transport system ATP-binding protein
MRSTPERPTNDAGTQPQGGSRRPAAPLLLQVRDLQVRFGAKRWCAAWASRLRQGEKLALVGESGSGKTITALSLLRLAGEAKISGQAMLRGRDLLLFMSEREMRGVRGGDIAMVFQEPMTALNPLMTIGQQIAEVLELKKGSDARSLRKQLLNC